MHKLDKQTRSWNENWLNDWAQRVVVVSGNFVDDTELGGVAGKPESHAAIQRDLQQAREVGQEKPHEVQHGKVQRSAPGEKQP